MRHVCQSRRPAGASLPIPVDRDDVLQLPRCEPPMRRRTSVLIHTANVTTSAPPPPPLAQPPGLE